MTWTRLSDDYADRPSAMGLTRSARLLDVEGLVWCNKHTTNGRLPAAALRRITDSPDPERDAAELVTAGVWAATPTGWQLDWTDQEAAEKVSERRDEWRRRDERRRHHNKGDHSLCDPKRCHHLLAHPEDLTRETRRESRTPAPGPSPVPLPTPQEGEGESGEGERSADAALATPEGEDVRHVTSATATPPPPEIQDLKAQLAAQREAKRKRRLSPVLDDQDAS